MRGRYDIDVGVAFIVFMLVIIFAFMFWMANQPNP